MPSLFAQTLLTDLTKLHNDPNGRLIIQSEKHWAVLHSLDVPTRALLEISSNTYLPKDNLLSEAQKTQLSDLSFTQRRRKRSLGKLVSIANATHYDQLITEISYVFEDIFKVQTSQLVITFTPNARHALKNKELLQSMKKMSQSKQHSLRIALYKTLLNSSLLLLSTKAKPEHPLQTGQIMQYPVFTCFTDYEAARCFDPRVGHLKEMYAYQIFKSVWDLNVGSLQINPKGDIGGELYRNEVETLIQAVNKQSR